MGRLVLQSFCLNLGALDPVVDFLAMNRHTLWGFDSKPHLVSIYFDHGNKYIVADDDTLVVLAG